MSTGSGLPRRRTPLRSTDPRVDRRIDIVLRLHREGGATSAELAKAMKVTARTMNRDLADLQAAGLPLTTGGRPDGTMALADGWLERFGDMSRDEVATLLLQVTPNTAGHLGLAAVASARRRQGTAPEVEQRAEAMAERCLLDPSGWFTRAEAAPHLPVLSRAVWDGHRVKVEYGRGESPEVVDPLGLVIRSGRWFVVAEVDGAPRSYRVNRFTRAVPTEELVIRPEGFVLAEWWTDSPAQLDGMPALF